MTEQRRLAAILVADVVGYSKLIGSDEAGTLAQLQALRTTVIEPQIAKHAGRLFKAVGDGFLVEFASAVQAVSCGKAIQEANSLGRLALRIGIHVGDVVVQGDDLMGDGVNVAARVEGVADAGGIAISRQVYDQIRDKLDLGFMDKGEVELKNIQRPVQVFVMEGAKVNGQTSALPLPDKPSIAVLPFQNLSGDPEQQFFVDGIVDDIITELARFRSLFVISRNSSFSYKGSSRDVRHVGRELGVKFVLEGSVRKTGDRVRLTAQLIEATTGVHRWAERYDRHLEDTFVLQEELTHRIVSAIAPEIEGSLVAAKFRAGNLTAYELAARARSKLLGLALRPNGPVVDDVIADARRALAIDPTSAIALCMLAYAQFHHLMNETTPDREAAWAEGMKAATQVIEFDRLDGRGYTFRGLLLIYAPARDHLDNALVDLRRAYDLNPNDMITVANLALGEVTDGLPSEALAHVLEAMRISPQDPAKHALCLLAAMACLCLGQYSDGMQWAQLGIQHRTGNPSLHAHFAMNAVGAGNLAAAQLAFNEAKRLGPVFVERRLAGGFPYRDRDHLRRATAFLQIAAGIEDSSVAEGLR